MYQIKKGFTSASKLAALPEICVVVAYYADKTFRLYNRKGTNLIPIEHFDAEKWQLASVEEVLASALSSALKCQEVEVLTLNPATTSRQVAGAVSFS